MLLTIVGLVFAVPILWAVSVGAIRELRRARRRSPRNGCQAWVAVPGLGGRRYRCCEPVFAGGDRCRRHHGAGESPLAQADVDAVFVDEPAAVGRALALARIGVPLAVVTVLVVFAVAWWAVLRTV